MLFLKNARVLTLDDSNTIADSVLIEDDIILAVECEEKIGDFPQSTQVVDLRGATVIPGLVDSHLHLLHYAQSLAILDCDTSERQACLDKVTSATKTTKVGEWIRGHGWNSNRWKENYVHKKLLDKIAPNHPVYLSNKSLHGAWVNSKALELCGINSNTPDPEGGKIGRDEHGHPNGLLYESAVTLVTDQFTEVTDQEAIQLIDAAQHRLFQYGITTVHDFDRIISFKALQALEQDGLLKLRVIKSLPVESIDEVISLGLRSGFGSPHLTYRHIKAFMDGALGTKTAAMLKPYENTKERGMLLIKPEELWDLVKKASINHLQLAIHSIGDLANRVVIETFQKLRKWEEEHDIISLPHRIEHLQTCDLSDIQKLARLNVIASVQPIHLASDVPAAEKWLGERCVGTYVFNSLLQANTPLIFGSDAPVELPDCMLGIHTAVHRTQRDNTPEDGWQPQEKLSPLDALKGFTRTPHQCFPVNGAKLGQLSPGFQADLVVLDRFPFDPEEDSFKDIKIFKTMIDGQWVWEG